MSNYPKDPQLDTENLLSGSEKWLSNINKRDFCFFLRREDELNLIANVIKTIKKDYDEDKPVNKQLIIVTGPSGAGKSVFLRMLLPSKLKEFGFNEDEQDYVNYYHGGMIIVPVAKTLMRQKLLILDQFEHLFGPEISLEKLRERQKAAYDEIDKLISDGYIVVIGIREDKYYSLRFLGSLVPNLASAIEIGRVNIDKDSKLYKKFIGPMRSLIGNENLELAVKNITMLEMQAWGALVELYKKQVRPTENMSKISPSAALQELVDRLLDPSPNKLMSLRILYALNQQGPRQGMSIEDLCYVINDSENDITKACNYLADRGLVVVSKFQNYEIAHDALKASFDTLTTERLRPDERDIIRYSVRRLSQVKSNVKKFLNNGYNKNSRGKDHNDHFGFAFIVMIALSVAVGIRLFFFKWSIWYKFSSISCSIAGEGFVDAFYLPIALPHLLWSYYIVSHYIRVFHIWNCSVFQRFLSIASLLNLPLGILIGMFLPEFWIAAIGWGGIVHAFKILSLGIPFKGGLSDVARSALIGRATRTIFNMAITIAVGTVVGLMVGSGQIAVSDHLLVLTYALSFLLSEQWAILFPLHISKGQAAYLRGLMRQRSSSQPNMA